MSDGYAMAATTAVMTARINARLVAADVGAVVGAFTVTSGPPDMVRPSPGGADPTQLNLFLHQVTPNATFRNADQSARGRDGRLERRPAFAVDLHYLMTAYGAQALFAEALLGHAAILFHEEPVLSRDAIRSALVPPVPAPVAAAGLDEQVDLIRISPEAISLEEMSRMWSALDAHYRPSLAYRVSVVLLESALSPGTALPATRRSFRAIPTLGAQLVALRAAAGPAQTLTMADTLVVEGAGLAADGLSLMFGELAHVPAPDQVRASAITLALTDLATAPLPGLVPVRAVIATPLGDPPVPHGALSSNTLALPLAATFTHAVTPVSSRVVDGVTYHSGDLTLTTVPAIGIRQRVELTMNRRGAGPGVPPRAYSFAPPRDNGVVPPAETTTTLVIRYTDVAAGEYLLRLRVDGVDSPLGTDAGGAFASPSVTL